MILFETTKISLPTVLFIIIIVSQLEEKKQENTILRQMLQSHGIEVAITSTANTTR